MIGYYKSKEQLDWILKNKYNFRTGFGKGSLPIGLKEVKAQYLLLHGPNETITSRIFKLDEKGIFIYSAKDLIKKEYPTKPKGEAYLMFGIEEDASVKFKKAKFDLKKLKNFSNFRNSPKPITVSLPDLMKTKLNEIFE